MESGHYDRDAVIERMRLAFELYEASEQMMRLNLRRRYPATDDEEIERRIVEWRGNRIEWLHTRPGAERRDVSGLGFRARKQKWSTFESLVGLSYDRPKGSAPRSPYLTLKQFAVQHTLDDSEPWWLRLPDSLHCS